MSIEIKWDNEDQTIIRWIYTGDFSWEEYDQASLDLQDIIADVDHNFATIFDMVLFPDPAGPSTATIKLNVSLLFLDTEIHWEFLEIHRVFLSLALKLIFKSFYSV